MDINVKILYLSLFDIQLALKRTEYPMKNDVEIRNFYYDAKMCYFLIKFKA